MTTATLPRPAERRAVPRDAVPVAETRPTRSPARALGWFSVGLGVAQLAAPRAMARLIGVRDTDDVRNLMLGLGVREVANGVGILTNPEAPAWAWARVGGDLIDLALLGRGLASSRSDRGRLAVAAAAVAGITVLDVLAGRELHARRQQETPPERRLKTKHTGDVSKTVTINRPPSEVYDYWHDFEKLPQFMRHLESVQVLDARRSHWKTKAPAGRSVEWDAEITADKPGQLISWRSVEGADVPNGGTVRFTPAPGGRGTEVHVTLHYDPPAGAIGVTIAKLLGEEPGMQVDGDLRRLKQVLETGEPVRSDASIHHGPHPARPSAGHE